MPSTDTHVGLRHSNYFTLPPKQSLRPSSLSGLIVSPAAANHNRPGWQFDASLFKILATINGSSLTRTTVWHPASNGIIERLPRQLKATLMCHADEHCDEALPLVLLGIRSAWKEDLKASRAELVNGFPLRLLGEFFAPSLS